MITLFYKSGQMYTFELKNREREMNFAIDLSAAHAKGAEVKYRVTNTYGIARIVNTLEIRSCRYSKEKLTAEYILNNLAEATR